VAGSRSAGTVIRTFAVSAVFALAVWSLTRAKYHHVFQARAVGKGLFRAKEEQRALLGGDAGDVDPRALGHGEHLLVGAQRGAIYDGISDHDDPAPVLSERAPHFIERCPNFFAPHVGRLVQAQTAVLTSRANLLVAQGPFTQTKPFETMQVMIQIVIHTWVGRGGQHQIDGIALHVF